MNSYYRIIKKQPKRKSWLIQRILSLNLTGYLIFLNIILFILFVLANILSQNIYGTQLYNYFALQANNLFIHGYVWTLLTSMFMHANFFHLFVNMFSLFFLGNFLEMIIGRKRFFWFYISSGIFAGLFFAILAFLGGYGFWIRIFSSPESYAVGASGAIFAIVGVLAVLTPKNKVYLILGPLLAIIFQAIIDGVFKNAGLISILDWIVTIYIFFSIFSLMSFNTNLRKIALPVEMPFWILPIAAIVPLILIGLFIELPIGNTAHLGGFIFGALYGFYLKSKYKRKTKMISAYFSK